MTYIVLVETLNPAIFYPGDTSNEAARTIADCLCGWYEKVTTYVLYTVNASPVIESNRFEHYIDRLILVTGVEDESFGLPDTSDPEQFRPGTLRSKRY